MLNDKMILFSDIHLGLYQSSDIWHTVVIDLINSIIDTCERNNIKTITFLGDWFDNRKSINVKTLQYSNEIMALLKDYQVNIIVGNHDTFYKDRIKPCSVSIYNKWDNINIIDDAYANGNIIMLPWSCYKSDDIKKYKKFDIVMAHLELNGFPMSSNYIFKEHDRLSAKDFEDFHMVYSGHFHIPSVKKNITYIGAPFQQTFNDINGIRGYYIYDNGETEFIEFTKYPKFVKIYSDDIIESDIKDNIVNFVFTKDYGKTDNNNMIEKIQSFGPLQFNADFSNVTEKVDIKDDESDMTVKDNKEILFDTIKNVDVPDHIKVNTLKKIIDHLMDEMMYGK